MALTRLYNGGTQPLIPADIGWGGGVIMPGESFETDHPETYGPPWVQDPETDAAIQKAQEDLARAEQEVAQAEGTDGHSGPQDGPQAPELHTLPNGDVVDTSGRVVGHLDVATATQTTPNQEATK